MIHVFKCFSGFYAVTYYDVGLQTWLVYWSGSKDLNDAIRAAADCRLFLGGDLAVIMTN